MNSITFCGRETLLTDVAKEAKKAAKSSLHEYKSNSMLSVVEKKAEAVKDDATKLTEAYRAKYAPYTVETNASSEIEKLTEEYKRSRGNV